MLSPSSSRSRSANWSYARAGVSIDRGNALVTKIKSFARRTKQNGVVGQIGGFSGFYDPSHLRMSSPLLVGTTDGVGTKLEIAAAQKKHDTIGIDLVAMCVNDLICTGAKPVFFLDYFACGKLDNRVAAQVIKGISKGCAESGCALIGGETAEMPGFYETGRYDLAGFAVGLVDKKRIVNPGRVRAGDVLLGLASSGFHSNGYSLLRKLFSKRELAGEWGRKLLTPTRIYVRPVLSALERIPVKGIAHITGGAFFDKLSRVVPKGLTAEVKLGSWPVPPMFREAARRGKVPVKEMYRTFNMGVGMVLVLARKDVDRAKSHFKKHGIASWAIGEMRRGGRSAVVLR